MKAFLKLLIVVNFIFISLHLEAHQWEFGFRVLQNGNYVSGYTISV